ncbi:hypothetical protein HJG60_010611 [Phyllostomus discolor]|uniref:Uncharacterized protein n=1 Tax=Phyllostomus discolor TaxID=89673 RepID=A0A834EEY9_9CHIR|nr:hypothetical protein HJG60_010611 [Phyllostomus discolor]
MESRRADHPRNSLSLFGLCIWVYCMLRSTNASPVSVPACKCNTPGDRIMLIGRMVSYYLPRSAFSSSTDMPLGCIQPQQSLCTWRGKVYWTGVISRTIGYQTRRCQAYGTLHPPDLGPAPGATVTHRAATKVLALQRYQHQYQQLQPSQGPQPYSQVYSDAKGIKTPYSIKGGIVTGHS